LPLKKWRGTSLLLANKLDERSVRLRLFVAVRLVRRLFSLAKTIPLQKLSLCKTKEVQPHCSSQTSSTNDQFAFACLLRRASFDAFFSLVVFSIHF
jgi:hypothetical protein